jgi:hypothetical protein
MRDVAAGTDTGQLAGRVLTGKVVLASRIAAHAHLAGYGSGQASWLRVRQQPGHHHGALRGVRQHGRSGLVQPGQRVRCG